MMEAVPSIAAQFSVVIPLFNKERHIRRAIESARGQLLGPSEIIVVDDGSTDDGASLVEHLALMDMRIHLIRQKNGGVSRARNAAIRAASGSHLAFLDADDEWDPQYLQEILCLMRLFPSAGAFGTSYRIIGRDGRSRTATIRLAPPASRFLLRNYYRSAYHGSPLWTSATVVPKDILDEVGLFLDGAGRGEDLHLWSRIAAHHDIALSRKRLATYHQDSDNRSDTSNAASPNLIVAQRRWWMLEVLDEMSYDSTIAYEKRNWIREWIAWCDILGAYKLGRGFLSRAFVIKYIRSFGTYTFIHTSVWMIRTCILSLSSRFKRPPK
jgi:glycosyltransferase involved in cell wall biosynthesis